MLRSKKVRMTAVGVLAVLLCEYVFGLKDINVAAMLAPIVSYILAQGWADQGKYRKEAIMDTRQVNSGPLVVCASRSRGPDETADERDMPPLICLAAGCEGIDLSDVATWKLTLWDVFLGLRNGREVRVPLSTLLKARVIFPEDEVSS